MQPKKTRETKDIAADQIGTFFSNNVQNGSVEIDKGMELFKKVVQQKTNVNFEQKKGDLFEYIEAAKFNRNVANSGKSVRAVVTQAIGEPHAPDDIRIIDGDKIVVSVQAKACNKASDCAFKQMDEKYNGMQRLVPKDQEQRTKELIEARASTQSINAEKARNAADNLTGELMDPKSGVKSGGTTLQELKKASVNPNGYAFEMEIKQYATEVGINTVNTAAANVVITGTVSSVKNITAVLDNKKSLDEAIREIGSDTVKSGARGAGTGFLSSLIRIGGQKSKNALLSEASSATALAGGIIDTGVSVYAYAKGEITVDQLKESLEDTSIKTISTVYFSKAVELTLGVANPFVPMITYTIASYVVTTCREIMKQAQLNATEYNRIAALYLESTVLVREQRKMLEQYMNQYVSTRKDAMVSFVNSFEDNLAMSQDYDNAIYAINEFATQFGIQLKHKSMGEFKTGMISKDDFVL